MKFQMKGYHFDGNSSDYSIIDISAKEIISLKEYNIRSDARKFLPKKIEMLMFMIDGVSNLWGSSYGGNGYVRLNSEGGYGFDRIVKKMLQRGEITVSRQQHHSNAHGGNPTINITYARVTDKGRAYYAKWKKRNG